MKRKGSLLRKTTSVLLPVAILAGGVAACFGLLQLRAEPTQEPAVDLVPEVTVVRAQRHVGGFTLQADGVVVPYRETTVSAEVSGRVVKKSPLCEAGIYITAGTPLLQLDRTDYEIEARRLTLAGRQAAIAIDELDEQVEGTQELAQLADDELALRERELQRQRDLGAVSRAAALDQAEASLLMARNNRQSLRNQLRRFAVQRTTLLVAKELADVQLEKANQDLERTEIVAPVSGVIITESAEQDSFVQRGQALFTIEDTSRVEVRSKLEMEDLFWLWSSQRPEVTSNGGAWSAYAFPGPIDVDVVYRLPSGQTEYTWAGRLERFDGVGLDEKTRTAPVRVVVPLPQRQGDGPPALVRGMYVELRIPVKPRVALWRIPQAAFRAGNVIWVVENGEASIVPANFVRQLPPNEAGEVDVLVFVDDPEAISENSQIAVSPLTFVKSGLKVKVAGTVP